MKQPTFDSVFLIRHGQTTWNVQHRHQGRLDSPLTDVGQAQAVSIGIFLAHQSVDYLACSPKGRALTTANIAAQYSGLSVVQLRDLQEIDQGEWSGLTDLEIDSVFPGARSTRTANKYRWRFPAGESYEDADRRAAAALSLIASAGVKRPALVTHEMISMLLTRNLVGQSIEDGMENRLAHGEILKWTREYKHLERIDPSAMRSNSDL